MPLRVVLRWIGLGAPFAWFGFATRFKASRDVVGPDFFKNFAARVHGTINKSVGPVGLMNSLDELKSLHFDPSKVHPVIRDFYERTSDFDLDFTIK
jgi:hypothetical protein